MYAPYSRLGNADDFKYLVDTLHQSNIGVFLDFVPAHFCKDDWGLARYDGEPCYEYADPREGEHKTWGTLGMYLHKMSFSLSTLFFASSVFFLSSSFPRSLCIRITFVFLRASAGAFGHVYNFSSVWVRIDASSVSVSLSLYVLAGARCLTWLSLCMSYTLAV